jgi:L-malate glycosyltransferase
MKKVLIIYKFLPQYRQEFFQKLREELTKDGIHLDLIYGKLNNSDAHKKDEIEFEWGQYIANKTLKIGNTELIWQPCLKHLNDKDLVIVEQANRLLLNYYLMVARHFSKYKFANWGHGRNLQDHANSIKNKFKFLFIKKCDWWFAYTNNVKSAIISHNFPENKITVVQNAIDTATLQKYYSEIKDSEVQKLKNKYNIVSSRVGIYCGGMYPGKRLDFILDTCKKIKESVPDFHMIFLGAGIESVKVVEAAKTNEWIHYEGPKFGREKVIYFKLASIQLMPCYLGLGILDSFALETPIITTEDPCHGPEIEYLENGKNGYITLDSPDDYSQTVIDILKNNKYDLLIDGCKKAAENYTVERMVDNFKNGIINCLAS